MQTDIRLIPGQTVIVLRHYTMDRWQAGWETRKLVIASDTAASVISRTETTVDVILSGGCRYTFPIAKVRRIEDYEAGRHRHSLVNPEHEDYVQKIEGHAAYAIRCAQEGTN